MDERLGGVALPRAAQQNVNVNFGARNITRMWKHEGRKPCLEDREVFVMGNPYPRCVGMGMASGGPEKPAWRVCPEGEREAREGCGVAREEGHT